MFEFLICKFALSILVRKFKTKGDTTSQSHTSNVV